MLVCMHKLLIVLFWLTITLTNTSCIVRHKRHTLSGPYTDRTLEEKSTQNGYFQVVNQTKILFSVLRPKYCFNSYCIIISELEPEWPQLHFQQCIRVNKSNIKVPAELVVLAYSFTNQPHTYCMHAYASWYLRV